VIDGASLAPEEYLHIPYTLMIWSTLGPAGEWVRHAEYPELPGCMAEATGAVEAIDQLDKLKDEYILTRLARGEQVPIPRPPLRA
jgi:predicted RNase H-like HicB family nuclease